MWTLCLAKLQNSDRSLVICRRTTLMTQLPKRLSSSSTMTFKCWTPNTTSYLSMWQRVSEMITMKCNLIACIRNGDTAFWPVLFA
ncbi:unnamed protein product [Durusdinium trenchii]|uniref:Uncharacterized protein n=1 Tax=Durusdinium trenchii TaxID=1381693 RepID=A0ABP0T1H5_9DINO